MEKNITREFFDSPFYLARGRAVIEARLRILERIFGALSNSKILDLGCGDGSLSIPFLNSTNELTLVDISTQMIEIARNHVPSCMCDQVDFINLPIDEFESVKKFQVVICVGVLAHVPSIEATLTKIAMTMEKNAIAVVEYTSNPNPVGRFFAPYYWIRRLFTKGKHGFDVKNKIKMEELFQMARNQGLSVVSIHRHLFPIPTMGFWPSTWVDRYVEFTSSHPIFFKFGVENVIVFSKLGEAR